MQHSIFWMASTLFFGLIALEISCEPFAKHIETHFTSPLIREPDFDDHNWWDVQHTSFPYSWRHENRGRKLWHDNRPEPPMSPFHPGELPIGLRTPFPGFRDSIYERVIKPHLSYSFVARQNNAVNYVEKNVLFRHEVENFKYQSKRHQIKKSRLSRTNYQDKEINNAKLFNGHKPQTPGIGDLPVSDPWKPILYNEFVYNP
ncbi:uncharacterized protein LOC130690591 [Daphnia carinata]|uniref:uncharacterized protein LOC130690591 n=1 Tax=Daphnia carinata TaxID=120202 RepID=UPI00257ED509|nr:uncharacterized protein LOC130690591 [Daphnia carinata]